MASPAALARIAAGMPATVQHGASASASGKDGGKKDRAVLTLTATERFITAMDSLKLQMKAVDELYPLVNEILDSISKFDALPPDHDSRTRVSKWVTSLHSMKVGRRSLSDLQFVLRLLTVILCELFNSSTTVSVTTTRVSVTTCLGERRA